MDAKTRASFGQNPERTFCSVWAISSLLAMTMGSPPLIVETARGYGERGLNFQGFPGLPCPQEGGETELSPREPDRRHDDDDRGELQDHAPAHELLRNIARTAAHHVPQAKAENDEDGGNGNGDEIVENVH